MVELQIAGVPLTYGSGTGSILKLDEPVSFWGGVDADGVIADIHHPQHGTGVSGRILAMTSGRGSSSGAYCLMELIRRDLAPAAIVLCEPDGIICLGALAAAEIYDSRLPIIEIPPEAFSIIQDDWKAEVVSELSGASFDQTSPNTD